jgi:hypothetical protein
MLDIRQTKPYANYLQRIGWAIEKVDTNFVFIKKFPFGLSTTKLQRPEKLNDKILKELNALAKKYKSFQVIIEPKTSKNYPLLTKYGYKLSKSPFLPTKTLHLKLSPSKKKLFNKLKKDVRYALRKTINLKITKYEINKLNTFRNAWKKAVGFKRHVPSTNHLVALKKSFSSSALFIASHNLEAGAVFLLTHDTAYYWQAYTSKIGRTLQAQYKLVWKGILALLTSKSHSADQLLVSQVHL